MRSSSLLPIIVAALLHSATAEPLSVPFVRQQKEGCGPAVLSMLIEYWSDHGGPSSTKWTPSNLYSLLYDVRVHGMTGDAMVGFLHEQDYVTFTFRGEWSDLAKNTELGRPIIVALAPQGKPAAGQPTHFVLVVGVDAQTAVIHDPDRGAFIKEPMERFLKQWKGTDRWMLLAVPRTRTDQFLQ